MSIDPARHPTDDQRIYMRFDKAFPVTLGSEVYGDSPAVARNICAGGMFVELLDPPPLGSMVTVRFRMPGGGSDLVAHAEVKHHYCLNVSSASGPTAARGVGLRFVELSEDTAARMHCALTRQRTIH